MPLRSSDDCCTTCPGHPLLSLLVLALDDSNCFKLALIRDLIDCFVPCRDKHELRYNFWMLGIWGLDSPRFQNLQVVVW
jgi:hypothetical protein